MHVLPFVICWVMGAIILVLIGVNRSMRKRHRKLEIALIDECNTCRDKLIREAKLIGEYKHLLRVETQMSERLLKEIERLKESNVELLAKLAEQEMYAGIAQQKLAAFVTDIRSSVAEGARGYVRQAIDSLKQITEKK